MSNTKPEFVDGIREAMRQVAEEQEGSERLVKAESALSTAATTITDLTNSLNDKDEEVATLSATNDELKEKVAKLETKALELQQKIDEATEQKTQAEERASTAEGKLDAIAKEQALETRMAALTEDKVLASESALEEQRSRVRDMSDEEFVSYKADRIEMRKAVQTELEEAAAAAKEKEGIVPKPGEAVQVEVPAADIAKARKEQGSAAGLNVEGEDNPLSKYNEMGKAMAAHIASAYNRE